MWSVFAAGGGFTDLLNAKVLQWQALAKGGITLLAIVAIGMVFITKRALVPVLGAILLSALALWAVWNTDVLRTKTQNEFDNTNGLAPLIVPTRDNADPAGSVEVRPGIYATWTARPDRAGVDGTSGAPE
jgi:hypothetical protein